MIIKIDEQLTLELTSEDQAKLLYDVINNNRPHLSVFLPWVNSMQSADDLQHYLRNAALLCQQGKELSFAIMLNGTPVGRIGLHHINTQNKNAAIGYWLSQDVEGRGMISRSCNAIITHGFKELGLHRIEIKAATGNLKSQAIPKRLHFIQEGVLRQAELVNNKFLDLIVYSMLSSEWFERDAI